MSVVVAISIGLGGACGAQRKAAGKEEGGYFFHGLAHNDFIDETK